MSDTADRVFCLWARGIYIVTAICAVAIFSYAATRNDLVARVVDIVVLGWFFYFGVGIYLFLPMFIWTSTRDWLRLTLYFIFTVPVGMLVYLRLC
ncbi:hypothetical protein DS878_07360 [Marinobacter sp. F3R11]|nr:hypothetical protein DS878_07360 [Marinobacter sp. F3R11]